MSDQEFRVFEDSGLKEGSRKIPRWLLLLYTAMTIAFIVYLIKYLY
jgi:hypothetical protein